MSLNWQWWQTQDPASQQDELVSDYGIVTLVKNNLKKLCTFNEAPPTRNPSISSFFASSALFPPFTDPKNQFNAMLIIIMHPDVAVLEKKLTFNWKLYYFIVAKILNLNQLSAINKVGANLISARVYTSISFSIFLSLSLPRYPPFPSPPLQTCNCLLFHWTHAS